MRAVLYQWMYSSSAVANASLFRYRTWWKSSSLRWPKKFSITALSKQLPLRDIDWVAPASASKRRQDSCWYWNP